MGRAPHRGDRRDPCREQADGGHILEFVRSGDHRGDRGAEQHPRGQQFGGGSGDVLTGAEMGAGDEEHGQVGGRSDLAEDVAHHLTHGVGGQRVLAGRGGEVPTGHDGGDRRERTPVHGGRAQTLERIDVLGGAVAGVAFPAITGKPAGQIGNARVYVTEARTRYPAEPCLATLAAIIAYRESDLGRAEALLREALRMDPQNLAASFNLGLLLASIWFGVEFVEQSGEVGGAGDETGDPVDRGVERGVDGLPGGDAVALVELLPENFSAFEKAVMAPS